MKKLIFWAIAGYLGYKWYANRSSSSEETGKGKPGKPQIDTMPDKANPRPVYKPESKGNNINSPLNTSQYFAIKSTNPNIVFGAGAYRRGTSNRNLLAASPNKF